ncbi:hypothetical protein HYFRA_00013034 [Hymenoscyphus fraxineus]|uniref:Peptidase A4 family protein n=1 Tax=Hymenoscyphus fraxineus TaxID=746836 RepID=A0A9N9L2T9_9HELO|nr:hypothetical protein HYFRA_00013034 [Hymenoscyphus fraxineus]
MKPLTLLFSLLGSMLVLAGTVPRAAEKDLGFLLSGHPHIPRDTGALGVKLNSPRHIPRYTSFHQSHPAILAQSPAAQRLSHPVSHISNAPPDQYSINWAGLVYEAPAPGQRFTFIGAYLVVPEYRLPPNAADATYLTAPWVGIDAGTPDLFQAGFTIVMTKKGGNVETEAFAWIEWLPQESIPVPEFQFKPGDTLEIRIFSDWNAATHGTITFVNHNTGQRVDKDLDAPSPNLALTGRTAEWIVEKVYIDPQQGSLPLTEFGAIHWTNCYAESKPVGGGDIVRYDLLGTTKFFIGDGSTVWTDVAISGPNDFWLAWKPRPE